MSAVLCIEIVLTIPDNEARTALATLQRLGIATTGLERADLYRCEVADRVAADRLVATLRTLEPIFNPNKHALRLRATDGPQAGEIWIEERDGSAAASPARAVRIAGRTLSDVRSLRRAVAWKLVDATGSPAEEEVVERAKGLLCNPAFQKATTV